MLFILLYVNDPPCVSNFKTSPLADDTNNKKSQIEQEIDEISNWML